jgi:hypothetical protein
MGVTDKIRQLRREIIALEASDHPDRERERRDAYIEALLRERAGAEQRLSHALSLGGDRERFLDSSAPTGYRLAEETGTERALRLDSQIGDIERELARVRKLR